MSEFKFACPVCGQHITADSTTSGAQIECPTCFQKIVVPQAPASGSPNLILSASQVAKPRPRTAVGSFFEPLQAAPRQSIFAAVALLLVLSAAGATVYAFRGKIFKPAAQNDQANNHATR